MARHHRVLAALVAAGLLTGGAVGPASAAPAITLHIWVGEGCFSFEGTPSTTHVVSLWDGTTVVDFVTVVTGANGMAWPCFSQDIASGMKVKAQKTGYSRTVTVPNLSVKANRVTDVVSGAGPASKSLSVDVERLMTGLYDPGTETTRSVTVAAAGTYSTDLTGAGGIRGGDDVQVTYENASGDTFDTRIYVEHMTIERGSPSVTATLDPGNAELVLRTSTGAIRARARLAPFAVGGHASGWFTTANGVVRSPRAGDKVEGDFATDAVMTIPAITVTAVASTDVVTVTCPGMPGQGVKVDARKADGSDTGTATGITNASGVRTFDLTSSIDLVSGDVLRATCRYDTGDEIAVHGRVGW